MTNRIALVLGLLVAMVFVADYLAFGAALPVFLGRKLLGLLDFIAFWR